MVITNSTAKADIFKEFYAVIDTNITTTGVTITNAFIDDTASFPQVVVHPPKVPRAREAFGTETKSYNRAGGIDIEVFAGSMKNCVLLHYDVENAIFSNLSDLGVQNVEVGDSSDVNIQVGGKTVHGLLIPISFKFSR